MCWRSWGWTKGACSELGDLTARAGILCVRLDPRTARMFSQPRPFTIEIPAAALTDLQRRLAMGRFPEREIVEDWSQGVPLAYVRELAAYWQTHYDWRRCEARLNGWPNYLLEVDGLD